MDAFAVVVNRHCQFLLNALLPDHILIQKLFYFQRFRDLVRGTGRSFDFIVLKNRITNSDAFVTDVGPGVIARGGDEFSDYVLALVAKRTSQSIIGSGTLHAVISSSAADRDWDAMALPSPPG